MKLMYLLSFLIIFAAAFVAIPRKVVGTEELLMQLVLLSPDKDLYHSAETLNLTVVVATTQELGDATLETKGIIGKLNVIRKVNLTEGINEFHVTHKLPRCNTCGGINPGNYSILAQVSYKNFTSNKTTTIEIQQ